jgi:recombinational DNA repair protein RecT
MERQECVVAGKPLYLPERERILGERAKQTERLAARAARRSRTLALAYSMSLAGAYLIMAADALARLSS